MIEMSAILKIQGKGVDMSVTPDPICYPNYSEAFAALAEWVSDGFPPVTKGNKVQSLHVVFAGQPS